MLSLAGAAAVRYLNRPAGSAVIRSGRPAHHEVQIKCSLYKYGNSVRLTLEGTGAEGECRRFAQRLSGQGHGDWVSGAPPLEQGLELVCALTRSKGSITAVVEDTGGTAKLGSKICGNLSHRGWTTDTNPPAEGPQEQEYNAANHEEKERETHLREGSSKNRHEAHLECLQSASTPADLQKCAARFK